MLKLLDCTLRDGGYINNWEFGYETINDMIKELEKTNVDILELGFIKNEKYNKDRTVFNQIDQITKLIPYKRKSINYAAMIEVMNPIPIEKLAMRTPETVDTIRVIIWKTKFNEETGNFNDALQEGFEYCKGIVERGYNLCVQPARVDQYSDEDFVAMLKLYEELKPLAIYIVDSWGTQNVEQIMHYVNLADKNLGQDISIGYHGHNNMMQAFSTTMAFIHSGINRDLIVDGSVYGIGRGAGNLNIELFAKYLNETEEKAYELMPMIRVYQNYIKKIYDEHKWGYSIPYFLTAQHNVNPNYGEYYDVRMGLSPIEIDRILTVINEEDKILYTAKKAEMYMNLALGERAING